MTAMKCVLKYVEERNRQTGRDREHDYETKKTTYMNTGRERYFEYKTEKKK